MLSRSRAGIGGRRSDLRRAVRRRRVVGPGRWVHRRPLGRQLVGAGAILLPVVISVAWIPLRPRLPNVDVALALVVAVTACGMTGRRSWVVGAAAAAAAGFAFFDTEPYERWVISRQPDLATLIVLAVVSLMTGELAVRAARARTSTAPDQDDMSRVRDIATLVASGAELVSVLEAVADELARLLGASSGSYEAGDPPAGAVVVGRDGALHRMDGIPWPAGDGEPQRGNARSLGGETGSARGGAVTVPGGRRTRPRQDSGTGNGRSVDPGRAGRAGRVAGEPMWSRGLEVPVTGMGRVLGRFVLPDPARALGSPRLLMALTLADQAGAALIAQAPESAGPPPGAAPAVRPVLRVVD